MMMMTTNTLVSRARQGFLALGAGLATQLAMAGDLAGLYPAVTL